MSSTAQHVGTNPGLSRERGAEPRLRPQRPQQSHGAHARRAPGQRRSPALRSGERPASSAPPLLLSEGGGAGRGPVPGLARPRGTRRYRGQARCRGTAPPAAEPSPRGPGPGAGPVRPCRPPGHAARQRCPGGSCLQPPAGAQPVRTEIPGSPTACRHAGTGCVNTQQK